MPTDAQPLPSAEDLAGLLEFERLISDLSSRFINVPAGDVDREIADALRSVSASLWGSISRCFGNGRVPRQLSSRPPISTTRRRGRCLPEPPESQEQFPWYPGADAGRPHGPPFLPWTICRRRPSSTGRVARLIGVKSNLWPSSLGGGRDARGRPGPQYPAGAARLAGTRW